MPDDDKTAPWEGDRDMAAVAADHFKDHVGTEFEIVSGQDAQSVVLVSVTENEDHARLPGHARMPFSVLFKGGPEFQDIAGLGSDMIRKEGFGSLGPLLVTRVLPPELGLKDAYLEVCFN
ncbi:hypothetical protein JM93_03041 [Roseibium hamelinense]|uniref:DUF6916 domain-containing protein n=1 Tax=Roseibium hamelinense TaxID=150831 RepID=A0A562STQ6_9HYPH|nr:hypothetical protein [Roseibium hamelinense]MTI42407.1 hypothetical protein [Roseibium hamelinense]TWI84707.1 hypothetical protein JM93_03041 [Roseibium hamelinense]